MGELVNLADFNTLSDDTLRKLAKQHISCGVNVYNVYYNPDRDVFEYHIKGDQDTISIESGFTCVNYIFYSSVKYGDSFSVHLYNFIKDLLKSRHIPFYSTEVIDKEPKIISDIKEQMNYINFNKDSVEILKDYMYSKYDVELDDLHIRLIQEIRKLNDRLIWSRKSDWYIDD